MYLPGLKYYVADVLSGQPRDIDIEDSGSGLCKVQDAVVFDAVEDWLKIVTPHLVLADCVEAMKTSLSSDHPVVALAYKGCSRQHLDHEEYAYWMHT